LSINGIGKITVAVFGPVIVAGYSVVSLRSSGSGLVPPPVKTLRLSNGTGSGSNVKLTVTFVPAVPVRLHHGILASVSVVLHVTPAY
jgi:hypothetical protein